ncbi:hypothetical protein [Paenibacillus sp. SI8]
MGVIAQKLKTWGKAVADKVTAIISEVEAWRPQGRHLFSPIDPLS